MEPILIEGTPKTPTIKFDASTGVFEIKGRSIPENSVEFYKPLIDWLDLYKDTPNNKTVVNIKLEYFNTRSSKCILAVFQRLEAISGGDLGQGAHTATSKASKRSARIGRPSSARAAI